MKAQDYWTLGLSLTAIQVSIFGVVYSGLLAQENRRAEGLQVMRSVAVASRMDLNNAFNRHTDMVAAGKDTEPGWAGRIMGPFEAAVREYKRYEHLFDEPDRKELNLILESSRDASTGSEAIRIVANFLDKLVDSLSPPVRRGQGS